MLDIFKITTALYDQIRSDSEVIAGKFEVEHSAYINMDADRAPWVGVYKGPVDYQPSSLGRNAQSWKATVKLLVIVQATHGGDSLKCSERLGGYEQKVLNAIWSDSKLGGEVDMIVGLNTEYSYNNEKSETMYHQQAEITITAEVSAG